MPRLRSLLFVPGDRPERMEKALGLGADALILDLEDAVAPDAKPAARAAVAALLARKRTMTLFVRINPLDSDFVADDLAAILGGAPDGIVLPKAEGASSLKALDAWLPENMLILPIATETPAAIFSTGTYGGITDRLAGLTWGAEDLPAAIGAITAREADGRYTPPYELARSLTLFGAHAAGVPAIETVYPDFRDLDGLAAYAARGRRDGFTGMMAIHPAQVPVINAAFTPGDDEIAHARRIVDLFAAHPGAGALSLDGRMVDAPHLKAARRLLGL
ncbi:HpcH/HpaI aldolase/citrate lyase family protein [Hephaestia sp. GCM10023244]|uniref:HpcH/HpaI aldolase/citrate lyase family protein n=1 Tax=unclassified Hephaestia TaxID=2631281 RepID=UPI00207714A0|nr:CoA ester lyase [Hephaestia sp. MAHUQ-44]MCM8730453.1 CoA ester lyase [Hephaestia sp. MAHUQ-44]